MPARKVLPALAAALIAAAAVGPPAAAAPGEGGGAVAGTPDSTAPGSGGGATYGQSAPPPKPKPRRRRRPAQPATARHQFPIAGVFDWGGPDGRFGTRRKGHRHQGQDLSAASGTPVVAPYRGTVSVVGYQAKGAGRYVVVHADDYDYVFMHLRTGSVLVGEGQSVRTGEQIAEVGSTGASSGPHLHFELWLGAWYDGGQPIDPLPLLQQWANPASG